VEVTEETSRAVQSNVLCFARNHNRRSHVGYNTVEVAPLPKLADSEEDGGEDDDSPLVA
jgi:hypothetical protein